MTIDQANLIVSKYEPMVVLCTYNILFTNDIVCSAVIDAIDKLMKTPLFRQRTKQLAKQVINEQEEYEKTVNSIIKEKSEFFADANERFSCEIKRHVAILYYSIKREFDKHELPQSDILTRMETARTLCDFACQQFDRRMEELTRHDARFQGFHLDYLRLTNLLRLMNLLMQTFRIPSVVDLNTTDCLTSIDILAQKLMDGSLIAKAISA